VNCSKRPVANATEFISLWKELTTLDGTGKAIPKETLMQPTSSSASTDHEDQAYPTNNAGAKHSLSTSSDSFDLQPPTPKSSRIATTQT